jgi:hypothetical protein
MAKKALTGRAAMPKAMRLALAAAEYSKVLRVPRLAKKAPAALRSLAAEFDLTQAAIKAAAEAAATK